MTGWPRGTERVVLEVTDSTNEEARRRFAAGERGPIWIQARRQTAGRGRMGRTWRSTEGNLAATLLMPFAGTPSEAARLSFVAALAVGDTLETLVRGAEVSLKWPNDALLNGKKASGILLENFGDAGADRLGTAMGIGINLAHAPSAAEATWPATSVLAEGGGPHDPIAVLDILAAAVDSWTARMGSGGFAPIRSAWLTRAARLNAEIEVKLPHQTLSGRFTDLDADGALVLETPEGPRRISAGDVFFSGGAS